MSQPPANCPRCESSQGFVPKLRDTAHGWQEEFIRCTVCRFETVIRYTTPEVEVLRKRVMGLAERMDVETKRHGQPSATLIARHREVRKELSTVTTDLYRKVREHGAAANPDAA